MSVDWEGLIPHIAHDVRALARKGLANAELLQRHLGSSLDAAANENLRAVIESQSDLSRLCVRLVALADAGRRPGSGDSPGQAMELGAIVLASKLDCAEEIKRVGAEIEIGQLPAVSVPKRTQIALRELVENSLRFRDPRSILRISIQASTYEAMVRIEVTDNGTGVPAEHLGKLFQPLQKLDAVRGGFGLGLAIAKAVALAAGGSVHYSSPSSAGARFVVEMPVVG